MEGFLEIREKKKGILHFSKFKSRYFVLNEGILRILKAKAGEGKGKIHLSVSDISRDAESRNQFLIDTGSTVFEIRASSESAVRRWVNAMYGYIICVITTREILRLCGFGDIDTFFQDNFAWFSDLVICRKSKWRVNCFG